MTQRQLLRRSFKLALSEPGMLNPYCEECAEEFESDTTPAELWTHLIRRHQLLTTGYDVSYRYPLEHPYQVLEVAYAEDRDT